MDKYKRKRTIKIETHFFVILCIFITNFLVNPQFAQAQSEPYTIKSIPKNGLNIDWPILKDRQYFTHKGVNARRVTLRSLMDFDCNELINVYVENPKRAFDYLELLILVQFALRGLDVQTMDPQIRRDMAFAEISTRLRQFGRIKETKALLSKRHVIPSVTAMCHILSSQKEDLLRQKYHVERKWDLDQEK